MLKEIFYFKIRQENLLVALKKNMLILCGDLVEKYSNKVTPEKIISNRMPIEILNKSIMLSIIRLESVDHEIVSSVKLC